MEESESGIKTKEEKAKKEKEGTLITSFGE